jgi:hypothetical protein
MSPFLVFLNAARNLAGMGMKREQVLDFAQREFGELTDLMKAQIDNIYKPAKSVKPKDPDFDDTVVKMKFDDEGKPFNPKDPLKNLSKKDKKADGGRIGLFKGAVASGEDISPGTDVGGNVRDDNPFSGGDRGGGGGNNFVDTTTKKKIIETGKETAKNVVKNKMFEKAGKLLGLNPKIGALLGIIGAIRGSTKESLPGDPDPFMEDQEGIPALANGGRIGLKDSVNDKQKLGILFPMKRDGFLVSPDFDNMTEEQKMYMEGMKIQEKKRQEKLRKLLEKFKESLPENERNIKPVPMPDRALPDTFSKGLASGGRVGFKKGLLASMMEGLSPDGGIFQSIFANRKHPILSTFNATELLSIGEALGPLIGFNEGGRVGLKDGMDRRKFLKIMGGLASLPVLGKFFKGAKVASTAVPAVKEAVTKAPSYFFRLVDKIRRFGKIIDDSVADPRVERTYKYKDYELKEGAYGDPSETIITKKTDMGPNGYKEESMRFKKGGQTEDGFVADEYEEVTARPDMDGKLKDVEEGIEDASEIIEEATKSAPPIKKAAGGLAYMLGE